MKTAIEMAREAGFVLIKSEWAYVDMLERFAELVRADEREACAKVCEKKPEMRTTLDGPSIRETVGKRIAAEIRARGNT